MFQHGTISATATSSGGNEEFVTPTAATMVNDHGGPWSKNPKQLMRTSNMLVTSSRKPCWHHWEWVWIKTGRKRWESGLKKGCQNAPTKNCKNCTENIPFLMRMHALQGCKHAYTFISLPVDNAQKNGRKKRLFEWVLVVFAYKWQPKKNCKIRPSNVPSSLKRSGNLSTINQKPSPVCNNQGLREKKEKEYFYHLTPQQQQLTCVHHGGFFVLASCWMPYCCMQTVFAACSLYIYD